MRSVPVPSSSVNCNSFFDFGTATHSLTFTARKSDLLNVSKSTSSSNKGSIFTLEKSIFYGSAFTSSEGLELTPFSAFTPPMLFIVGSLIPNILSLYTALYNPFFLHPVPIAFFIACHKLIPVLNFWA